MPRENVRVKSVHFNTKNLEDQILLNYIGKKNFSRFVKQLIKMDMEEKNGLPKQPVKRGSIKYLPKKP